MMARLPGRPRLAADAYAEATAAIRHREASLRTLSDGALGEAAARLRAAVAAPGPAPRSGPGQGPECLACFALASEFAHRVLGMRPFDVQIAGALALADGRVVEMAAGEGKTLTAVLPAAWSALAGGGFHVLTANDYLAGRDAEWMGPLYRALGLTVGHVGQGMETAARRAAYAADVTYVAATEAGFDYLRDRLAYDPADLVQRPFAAALVDEVDSILIDESRIPLVIAGGNTVPEELVRRATRAVAGLASGRDYEIDLSLRSVVLTPAGIARIESAFACGNLFEPRNLGLLTAVNVALHAAAVLRRDVDYIVRDGVIRLVDELKGRVADRRRWPDGVHTALEAKEGLKLTREGRILGTLTVQSFIKLYPRLCGMTGTAAAQAAEFLDRYGLEVVVIPPNRPCIRQDRPDQVFLGREAKEAALERVVREAHARGRPVLIGTASVEESERLAARLAAGGIAGGTAGRVLNARNDAQEAAIVAEAGDVGAVTISTNMAGRGTDIKLGGPREERAAEVRALGGLLVLGTNHHEARRIDQQLRGRAGRQGDPGESCFYVSLEDDLFTRHGLPEALPPGILGAARAEPLQDPRAGGEIERAQRILEGRNAAVRKSLWQYDRLIDGQRRTLYQLRDRALRDAGSPAEPLAELQASLASQGRAAESAGIARRIAIAEIDRHWSDYLAEIAEIREGIMLRVLGNQDPLFEFQKLAVERFDAHLDAIARDTAERLRRAALEAGSAAGAAPPAPGTTWTYLMNEDTFAPPLERFVDGFVKLLKERRTRG